MRRAMLVVLAAGAFTACGGSDEGPTGIEDVDSILKLIQDGDRQQSRTAWTC